MALTSLDNLDSLLDLAMAREAEIEIALHMTGCFSASSETVRVSWSETTARIECCFNDGTRTSAEVPEELARSFAVRAAKILAEAGPGRGDKSTTRHFGSLRWSTAVPSSAGRAEWSTTSLPPEDIAELLEQRPDLAARIPPSGPEVAFEIRNVVAELQRAVRLTTSEVHLRP